MTDKVRDGAGAQLSRAASGGCAESRLLLSRRQMLGVTAGLFSWAYMPRYAEAASTDPRLLVVILRGGLDGLNTCVPIGDRHYASMRGQLAIPAAKTIRLNSFFGLHPAMPNFAALYKNGNAAVVHATALPFRSRSHFDSQANLENGLPGLAANSTGWLNRLLVTLPASAPIKMRGAIQITDAPLILRGEAPVLGWSAPYFRSVTDPTLASVRSLYQERDVEMSEALELGLRANSLAAPLDQNDGDISQLRKAFRGAGRLLQAPSGPRIAVLSVYGFDTHSTQGGVTGELATLLAELDAGLADFKSTVGAAWSKTVVVCPTEFGRNVRANGDGGSDHGVGTAVLLAGGAVNGGRVFGNWPGLAPAQLYDGLDLKPTTDMRSIFKGVLRDHVGVPINLLNTAVFPDSALTAKPMADLVKSDAAAAPVTGAFSPAPVQTDGSIAKYRQAHGRTIDAER